MPVSPTIAYFSAEYAVADDLPIYAGGLGILAADTFFQAGDDGRDFYAIGLTYHKAFTGDDDGRSIVQRMQDNGFELLRDNNGAILIVEIGIGSRRVKLQAWKKIYGSATMLLLDARVEGNHPDDHAISDSLYAAEAKLQFTQEVALGFGGVAILEAIGVKPGVYHLNEGHTAITSVAVAATQAGHEASLAKAFAAVRPLLRGTKHTILSAAGLFLDAVSVEQTLQQVLAAKSWSIADVMDYAQRANGDYSDTQLLITATAKVSGVSAIHVAAEAKKHAGSQLIAITNGVYAQRWRAEQWPIEPHELDDGQLWDIHNKHKLNLVEAVANETGTQLDPNALTVVWARRMTAYKRPALLVSDLNRIATLVNNAARPVQFIVSGHANPADSDGIELMNQVVKAANLAGLSQAFAYLPRYNPASAKILVRGADVWLNTPIRGMEACGTSGMKASLNGAVQFSTSDGWIDEIDIKTIGWKLAEVDSAISLYDILEEEIIPQFYSRTDGLPSEWIAKMRNNIDLVEQQFTSKRMLNDYYSKLYT